MIRSRSKYVPLLPQSMSLDVPRGGSSCLIAPNGDDDSRPYSLLRSASSSESDNSIPEEEGNSSSSVVTQSRGLLLLVAILYGTLTVALRGVYQFEGAPNASTLSAVRGWLASLGFVPLLLLQNKQEETNIAASSDDSDSKPNIFWPALELAVYNLGSQGLLNIGLLSVESARASFLTQLSVVLTPIVSYILGKQLVSKQTWLGCAVAVVGVFLLSGVGGATASAIAAGDLFVVGGALSWSLYLFRLSKLSTLGLDEFRLQAWKTFLLAILYSVWMIGSFVTSGSSSLGFLPTCFPGWQNVTAWLLLTYSAIGPGTAADILQQRAQQHVSASESNIWLSLEPVFAALFGFLLLGEGFTSITEWMGGGLILAAAFIATQGENESSDES